MKYFRNYAILYQKQRVSVYFFLFYSLAFYGCLVWSYSTQRNVDRIINLQKRCIRIITCIHHYESLRTVKPLSERQYKIDNFFFHDTLVSSPK